MTAPGGVRGTIRSGRAYGMHGLKSIVASLFFAAPGKESVDAAVRCPPCELCLLSDGAERKGLCGPSA
ncbi:hypothetical protein [Caproicibacter sp. BJN0012]|uniref:hypothetical protein n=1 Tax=Caproicibacter sp. BJN0012 TaxID=3110227 RepID=UPI002E13AB68